jgi:hypothetical protein
MSKPSLIVAALVLVVALAIATAGGAEGPKPGETLPPSRRAPISDVPRARVANR